jgi:hypothetical protein
MTHLRVASLAAAVTVVYACLAYAQTPPPLPGGNVPDFTVQVWGYIVADFSARIDRYLEMRKILEQGLPPPRVTENPAEILEVERALARRIRAARAGARRGDIFTADIRAEFTRVLQLVMDADTRRAIMDENPGSFSHGINGTYPKERPLSTVPANVLALLPRLPDDIQYRFLGRHLILHDIRANVILDRLPCAIRCAD